MVGGVPRLMMAFVGVLAALRFTPDVVAPAAAVEGSALWGWEVPPPGPSPVAVSHPEEGD